jgi:CBS domain-containing protein
MLVEETVDFLKDVPPFHLLDEAALMHVARAAALEYHPRGKLILVQNGPPSDSLRVIKKGGVKVFINAGEGEQVTIDYRSEGDSFGLLSVLGQDKSRANVFAIEDTLCYRISKDNLQPVMDTNPSFTEFFFKSFLNKYIDGTQKGLQNMTLVQGGGDKLLFTTPVGEIATRDVVTASRDLTIREAAGIMAARKVSYLVLLDETDYPVGIVTDKDLRDRVVAKNRNGEDMVAGIMNSVLIGTDAQDSCFEALLRMIKHSIHHLIVVDKGQMKGILTNDDLMVLQGSSPVSIVREIDGQNTIDGLVPLSHKISTIIGLLIKEGTRAGNIAQVVTEVNDRLVSKVFEIAERKFGPAPVRWCWMAMGSEGRKEQVFGTDQDNGIIYADPASEDQKKAAMHYFGAFAAFVNNSLELCGFERCHANVMAMNPKYCQPLRNWKKYYQEWINAPTIDSVVRSQIFFDFRPLYGDQSLAQDLRSHITQLLTDNKMFLGTMANILVHNPPPIGFFKGFVVEKNGQHENELNIKIKGTALFVDILRLFSLEKGISETSTLERIEALRSRHAMIDKYGEELEHAFDFVMFLRIRHELQQLTEKRRVDHFLNPDTLSKVEKKMLKEAFELVEKLQDFIIERYKASMV